ncbi:NAD binding domain of 6-phosphogluconate dehydrogenase [Aspergillus bombycis]|uniref:NAD binding domain of 6-phosphogluconate dehydrogenase n=1 Tax=Aspergillus bombycis TaxID=109264 RepID=A0A1F8AA27_9EURO|nr:NAD binding domain of 6-phosphogluconate dehydrogenase [Aspergillus bombycis]OGM48580.1 NAD binding domain of 6-phosphogluconate dehydrogenase [Aspergillus bombycis]
MTRIGWYGLGSMGLAMATNLQRHLATKNAMNLIYSNRTMARGDPLKTLGATPETSFAKLVAQCGIIFTMVRTTKIIAFHKANTKKVSNDAVLQQLITSAIGSGHSLRDKIFVDCSTVHPETVGLTVSKLREQQASFLAAPVFGGNPIAVDGKLVFAIAGPKKASEVVKPLIQGVMGRKVIDCGEDATKSSLLKIAGNIVTVNMMEAVGEAQVFAERTGLGTGPMEELIGEAFGAVAGGYSKRLTTGAYAPPLESRPGFGVSLAIKDANHAFAMAKEHNVELPGLKVAHENMVAAREYAGECLDSSSMYGVLRQKAGMAFWNEKSRKE